MKKSVCLTPKPIVSSLRRFMVFYFILHVSSKVEAEIAFLCISKAILWPLAKGLAYQSDLLVSRD